jgi:CheY-like chemotaxis protein
MVSTSSAAPICTPRTKDSSVGSTAVQKVLIVNGNPEVLLLAEQVVETGHYDMIFVESVAHAYSQVRRVQPNLVILCLGLDDVAGLQVLSMLKLDARTREIPVLTYSAEQTPRATDEEGDGDTAATEFFTSQQPALMN